MLQCCQTKSHAVIFHGTLPAECIGQAICMKTEEQLYQRESARPRVVLRANSQCGFEDLSRQEARSSWETQSDAQSFWENGCNIVNYGIPGMSLSTVQQQDEQRQHTVAKLTEMFESHQHQEQFLEDVSQTQRINRISEASQKLLRDMTRQRSSNSVKILCSDCNSFTEIGIIYCSCGRNLKTSRSPTTFQKDNYDFNSIPGYIIKKNSSRGPKYGQSERQIMFFAAKDMPRKAKNKKNGIHPTILSRWKAQESYRTSFAKHNNGEKEIMLYDQIALENHDYTTAKVERTQNSKHWVLSINAEGPQLPRQQRPDHAEAKKKMSATRRRVFGGKRIASKSESSIRRK